jgi:RNA polymerase sigma factor (sigma-70 family)
MKGQKVQEQDRGETYRAITEKYAGTILNWAVRKTGSRQDGEDLAQETFLQVFSYLARGNEVRKTENFIWKVARNTWCNYLRKIKRVNALMPLDETVPDPRNVIDELAEEDSLRSEIALMRRRIADLSSKQRETMILYYLEGCSVRQVAKKLALTESAVKKHLFDARNTIKGELVDMKTETSYVYRPGRLVLGATGLLPDEPDTAKVNDNLVRQNLLLLCRGTSRKTGELAELTGIPRPYLEPELDWLTRREFLSREGKKYSTIIPITGKKHRREVGACYNSGEGKDLIDTVLSYLWEKEDDIRKIGFYGSDFSTGRLMWAVIMLFLSYFSRYNGTALRLKNFNNMEVRPDGGKYYVIGNDQSDSQDADPDGYTGPEGWGDFYGICSDSCEPGVQTDSYYWLGLYNFAKTKYHPDIVHADTIGHIAWYNLYCRIIEPGFDIDNLTGNEKEMMAVAVRKGLVSKRSENYAANFLVMSAAQLERLQVGIFSPLLKKTNTGIEKLAGIFTAKHIQNQPKLTKVYGSYLAYLDLWHFGIYSFISAAEQGLLSVPAKPEEGIPLTLVLVK